MFAFESFVKQHDLAHKKFVSLTLWHSCDIPSGLSLALWGALGLFGAPLGTLLGFLGLSWAFLGPLGANLSFLGLLLATLSKDEPREA